MGSNKTSQRILNSDDGANPPVDRTKKRPFVVRHIVAPLFIVLAGMVFLYPLWTRREIVYSKHSDIISQHLSAKAIGQRSVINEGRLPLWNPSMNGGAPAFANPETAYIFPLDLLFLVVPIDIATNLVFLLNVLLAGLTMYLFCRQFLKQPASALFCALAYMLSYRCMAMIYAGWLPKMAMYALTPLLFWSCERLLRKPAARRIIPFSVVVALTLLQGDMQQLYYSVLACVVYAIVRIFAIVRPARLRACLYLTTGGLLGIMLAAPVLLPRLEYASLSTRTGHDYEFFLDRPPAVPELKTLLDPDDRGGNRDEFWEKNFYFGFWLFPLWLFAFCRGLRRPLLLFLAGAVMVFLCFDTIGLKCFYQLVPGFKLFRQSPRILLLAQFALLLPGGLGVDALLSGNTNRHRIRIFSIGVFVTVAVVLIAAVKWEVNPPYVTCGLLSFIGLVTFVRGRAGMLTIVLLCLLPILDSASRIHPMISTVPLSKAAPQHAVHKLLSRKAGNGRTIAIGRTSIPYGMAGYYEVDMVNGYAPLTLKHYIEYFYILQFGTGRAIPQQPVVWTDFVNLAKPAMLGALDVRYIVTNERLSLEQSGYKKIARYEQVPVFIFYRGLESVPVEIWRLENPLGPAYFATSVNAVENESQSLDAIVAATSVLDAHVMGLDRNVSELDYAGGTAELLYRGINRYEYRIESQGNNLLILSQVWYPGWAATLNGQKTKLYRTNHAMVGCFIPPGRHRLTLEMTSPPLRYGVMIAMVAVLILVILFVTTQRITKMP